jgi:hypothetical protein
VISGGSCRDFLLLHPLEEQESVVIFGIELAVFDDFCRAEISQKWCFCDIFALRNLLTNSNFM